MPQTILLHQEEQQNTTDYRLYLETALCMYATPQHTTHRLSQQREPRHNPKGHDCKTPTVPLPRPQPSWWTWGSAEGSVFNHGGKRESKQKQWKHPLPEKKRALYDHCKSLPANWITRSAKSLHHGLFPRVTLKRHCIYLFSTHKGTLLIFQHN